MFFLLACAFIDDETWRGRIDPDGDGIPGTGADDDEDCAPFDAALPTSWYLDADGDDHGTTATISACTQPEGYAPVGDDCDDAQAAIHPGAEEICDPDDTDEDCDGLADDADKDVDAGTGTAWYGDSDGDGHAGEGVTAQACDPPAGTEAAPTDCDDTNAAVYPGAPEVCDDGVDNDCDPESLPDCRPEGEVPASELDLHLTTTGAAAVGFFVAMLPDLDGDGDAELALGTRNQPDETALFYLVAGGARGEQDLDEPGLGAARTASSDYPQTGVLVRDATALTGAPALLVGVFPNALDEGQERIGRLLLLGQDELAAVDFSGKAPTFTGSDGDYAARDAPALGDLDADGHVDLAIPTRSHAITPASEHGAVFLVRGDGTGSPPAMVAGESNPLMVADHAGDKLGSAVGARDLNGDGFDDLLAAAPGYDNLASGAYGPDNGVLYVLEGPVNVGDVYTNLDRSTDLQIYGAAAYDTLGADAALDLDGDADEDGYDDIFVGAESEAGADPDTGAPYSSSPGRAYLVPGGPRLISGSIESAPYQFLGSHDEDQFGHQVRHVGDLDGDGHPDLAVASGLADRSAVSPTDAEEGDNAGRAWIFYGPLGGSGTYQVPGAADLSLLGADGDRLGVAFLGGADLDNDGRDDLLLGTPGSGSDAGGAWILYGRGQ